MLVPVDRILEEDESRKISLVLCYPRPADPEVSSRIKELYTLGVDALLLRGRTNLAGVPVLGKGHVGVVVAAMHRGREVALKIRRVDADRGTMRREAEMLRKANSLSVGPRLLGCSDNFLLMELVEGKNLQEWLRETGGAEETRLVLRELLQQCRRLDEGSIDHGELSRAHRHVVVTASGQAHIIDFETASTLRRPSNVTSIAHYLFFHRENSEAVQRILGEIGLERLQLKLGRYKKEPTEENFKEILEHLRLET
jgi:putative serine/threonine protein kinase